LIIRKPSDKKSDGLFLLFAGKYDIADYVYLFAFKIGVEGQGEYLFAYLQGDRGIVGIESAAETIESVGQGDDRTS
jgi:hypothetical protein